MAVEYPDVPGVEVLLNGRTLPREQWERYAVHVSDLLDAKSGTRCTTYGCNGTVTIQPRNPVRYADAIRSLPDPSATPQDQGGER